MKIEIDISAVEGLATKLADVNAGSIGAVTISAINHVIDQTYDLVRPRMIAQVNMRDDYVRQRMEVMHASDPNNAQATIVARGSGGDMTILGRYGAIQQMVPSKKGGTKRGGVSVEVLRGSVKTMPGAYLMALKGMKGEQGIFTRDAGGKSKHRYGPSVYQLFNVFATQMVPEVTKNFEAELVSQVDALISKALT